MTAQRVIRGRRGFTRRPRVPMTWGRTVDDYTAVAAATKVLLFTFVLSNMGIGETMLRTRGRFSVLPGAASEQFLGAWGAVVVTDLAVAAGVASLPGPFTDASDDGWFVWEPFSVAETAATISEQYEFDSKAQRRVEEGSTIAVVCEAATGSAAFSISIGFSLLSRIS